ncbi:acyloxyacyl hydrolase [Pseudoalteromonas sp. GB56]
MPTAVMKPASMKTLITTFLFLFVLLGSIISSRAIADEIALYAGYTLGANDDDRITALSYSIDTSSSFDWADGFVFTFGEFNGLDKKYSWNDFEDVFYFSAGAYWQLFAGDDTRFTFEFSPTYIDGNYYYAHYVGSRWHFMSSLNYTYFIVGSDVFTSLRYQHTSNGGLAPPNPGVDGLGLQIGYRW